MAPPAGAQAEIGAVLDELGAAASPRFKPLVDVVAHESPAIFVAETAHFLTILHGELPSVLDHAGKAFAADWLDAASAAFHADRAWLTTLSVETGPRVELSGLTQTEQAVRGIRDAMLTLVCSAREGCALGVAAGFVTEWPVIAAALDDAGSRLFAPRWPSRGTAWPAKTSAAARAALTPQSDSRPVRFGVVQYAALHAQLFELLGARARLPRA